MTQQRTIRIPKPRDPFEPEIKARIQLLQLAKFREREPKKQTMEEIVQQLRRLAEMAARIG